MLYSWWIKTDAMRSPPVCRFLGLKTDNYWKISWLFSEWEIFDRLHGSNWSRIAGANVTKLHARPARALFAGSCIGSHAVFLQCGGFPHRSRATTSINAKRVRPNFAKREVISQFQPLDYVFKQKIASSFISNVLPKGGLRFRHILVYFSRWNNVTIL